MKKFLSLKRAAALCLAVCMIAGLLAGCGGGSSDTSDGGAAAEVDTSTLTVALTSEPDYLSTCDHDSLMGVQMNLLTYNGLMRIDMETLEPVCDLAESYTQDYEDAVYDTSDGETVAVYGAAGSAAVSPA